MNNTDIYFLTKNSKKLDTATSVLGQYNINVISKSTTTPDFYSEEIEDFLNFKLTNEAKNIHGYILVSKVGYFIDYLNGFPGFNTDYINKTLTSQNILDMMTFAENRRFTVKTCLGFYNYKSQSCHFFYGINGGSIAQSVIGIGTTLDKIMIRDGQSKPQGLYSYDEMINYYSNSQTHYHDLAKFIQTIT